MNAKIANLTARRIFAEHALFGLKFKALRLFCDHCDKYISSRTHWTCGHCDFENILTWKFSFLYKCARCKRPPASYSCPHCGKTNLLGQEGTESNQARLVCAKVPVEKTPVPAESDGETKERLHQQRKTDIEREIEIAHLTAKLDQLRASSEFKKEVTLEERLRKDFSEHDANVMGIHRIAREQIKLNAERYADDPEERERADESVRAWVEGKL